MRKADELIRNEIAFKEPECPDYPVKHLGILFAGEQTTELASGFLTVLLEFPHEPYPQDSSPRIITLNLASAAGQQLWLGRIDDHRIEYSAGRRKL